MIIYPESQNYYPEVFHRYKELSDEFSLEDYQKGDYEIILIYKQAGLAGFPEKDKIKYPNTDIRLMSMADFYKIYGDRFLIPVTDEKIDNILNLLSAGVSSPTSRTIVRQLSYTYDLLSNEKFRTFMFNVQLTWPNSELNKQLFQFRDLLTELIKFNYYDNRSS